jgi:thioester reductase-like protein
VTDIISGTTSSATGTEQRLRDAARAITALNNELVAARNRVSGPIAVTGIAVRLPGGASTPEEFWELLARGADATSDFPACRGDASVFYDPDPEAPGCAYVTRGGFLRNDVGAFEPEVFGISPREATGMDPQQRMALELCWEALERAGHAPDRLTGSATGVWIGVSTTDYVRMRQAYGDISETDAYQLMGEPSFIAGRVSFTFGLRGPSVVLDTACSSSLVAVHSACQSLRRGECDIGLAGGVNLMLMPYGFVLMSKFRALSPDGRCKAFDASADGYARGEGGAIVVLKRLPDAIAAGDTIIGVIRGSAVNHDGRSSGISVPNPSAQQNVIRAALADAGVAASDIRYVEAHGTGTSLGDPIELNALDAVLGPGRAIPTTPTSRTGDIDDGRTPDSAAPLLVGSVKTNIGHLEPAAGAAALAKVLLAMEHERIPAHLHLQSPNPKAPWSRLRLAVPTESTPWPGTGPKLAGISSFGVTGTNAHVIIEEPPRSATAPDQATPGQGADVLTLSARTPAALRTLAHRWADELEREPHHWKDLCWTSQIGRARHAIGLVVPATNAADAAKALRAWLDDQRSPVMPTAAAPFRARSVTLLFTGQGSQYPGMAADLLDLPLLRDTWQQLDAAFAPRLGISVATLLHGQEADLNDTRWTQPALFVVEYALAKALMAAGIQPALLAGHSIGEIAAATVAGALDLEDAAELVVKRASLMAELPRDSGMLAVQASETAARAAIGDLTDAVSVAAVNGPGDVVLAGFSSALETVAQRCRDAGHRLTLLPVSHGFHSPAMDPAIPALTELGRRIPTRTPRIPLLSNVTGDQWENHPPEPDYWARHARSAVRFRDNMVAAGERTGTFIEVGPHPTLTTLGQRCVTSDGATWLSCSRRGADGHQQLLTVLGALHLRGLDVDWDAVRAGAPRRRVPAPGYAWDRRHFWYGDNAPQAVTAATASPAGAGRPDPVLGVPAAGVPGMWTLPARAVPMPVGRPSLGTVLASALRAVRRLTRSQLGSLVIQDVILRPVEGAVHARWMAWDSGDVIVRCDMTAEEGTDSASAWTTAAHLSVTSRGDEPPRPAPITDSDTQATITLEQAAGQGVESAWTRVAAAVEDLLRFTGSNGQTPHTLTVATMHLDPSARAETVTVHGDPDAADGAAAVIHDCHGNQVGHLLGLRRCPAAQQRITGLRQLLSRVSWVDGTPTTGTATRHAGPVIAVGHQALSPHLVAAMKAQHASVIDRTTIDGQIDVPAVVEAAQAADSAPLVVVVTPQPENHPGAHIILDLELAVCRLLNALEPVTPPAQVRVLTWSALRATPSDTANGYLARTLWGLGRVAALEYPDGWAGLVDAEPHADVRDIAAAVLDGSAEDEIAVRAGAGPRVLIPRLISAAAELPSAPAPLDPEGTVLITGAFGGIGRRVVRWLRDSGVQSFVLVSRAGSDGEERAALLAELAADECSVIVAAADVSDAEAMRAVVADIEAAGRHLTGVVHAAGVSGPQNIIDVDKEAYRRVWEPKVLGALALHEATESCDLQLFLCFSSIAATWGSQHLASYAAGNAFLDGLCERRRASGLAGVSVSWGPWDLPSNLFDQEVMRFLTSVGLRALAPDQCIEILDRLASLATAHWVVCDADWSRYREVMSARRPRPLFSSVAAGSSAEAGTQTVQEGPLAAAADQNIPRVRRQQIVEEFLRQRAAAALGVSPEAVTASDDVFALGMDSLMVMEISTACRTAAGVDIASQHLFERSSISGWTTLVLDVLEGSATGEGPSSSGGISPAISPAISGDGDAPDDAEHPAVLDAYAALPPDLAEPLDGTGAAPRAVHDVLLTGATGFVGTHLLRELLDATDARIHCLVRAPSAQAAHMRLTEALRRHDLSTDGMERVTAVPGDLAAPGCGLTKERFAELARHLDVIIHNGARVNFVHTFEQLRPVNVDATVELLRLARKAGNVPFHLVSTYGVWCLPAAGTERVTEDGDLLTSGRLVTGYTQTKWVADRLAGRAREAGQAVAVHRLGRVVCDSNGRTVMLEHFTTLVLKSCVELGAAPDLDVELEITPVDYVARALVALAMSPSACGLDYHLINDSRMPFREMVSRLGNEGYQINVLDRLDWWELLHREAENRGAALRPVLPTVRALIVEGERAINYDAINSRTQLAPLGITCPPLDGPLLSQLVAKLQRCSFLPVPHHVRQPLGEQDAITVHREALSG